MSDMDKNSEDFSEEKYENENIYSQKNGYDSVNRNVNFGNVSDEDYDRETSRHGSRNAKIIFVIMFFIVVIVSGCVFISGIVRSKYTNSDTVKGTGVLSSYDDSEDNGKESDSDGENSNEKNNVKNDGEDDTGERTNINQYASEIDGVTKLSTSEIYASCVNSVVGITTEGTTTNIFGQISNNASTGTGIIYSSDGYILTNYHVVESGSSYTVNIYDGTSYKADLVGYEADNDVALLKVEAEGLLAATLGDSEGIIVGEDVIVIGNPLGELTYTLTRGVVSALNRVISTDEVPINMFQIDAAVNAGNSGGPAFDATGRVIGIVTAKYSSESIEGIGFCIPINDAVKIAEELIEYGYIRGKAGIGICASDGYLTSGGWFNSYMIYGAKVTYVNDSYDCVDSGLSVGDLIIAVDDTEITSASDLETILKSYSIGEKITVSAYHNTGSYYEAVQYEFKLGEYSPSIFSGSSSDGYGNAM